jgi:hypothetical protein
MHHRQAEILGSIVVADSPDHVADEFLMVRELALFHLIPEHIA